MLVVLNILIAAPNLWIWPKAKHVQHICFTRFYLTVKYVSIVEKNRFSTTFWKKGKLIMCNCQWLLFLFFLGWIVHRILFDSELIFRKNSILNHILEKNNRENANMWTGFNLTVNYFSGKIQFCTTFGRKNRENTSCANCCNFHCSWGELWTGLLHNEFMLFLSLSLILRHT